MEERCPSERLWTLIWQERHVETLENRAQLGYGMTQSPNLMCYQLMLCESQLYENLFNKWDTESAQKSHFLKIPNTSLLWPFEVSLSLFLSFSPLPFRLPGFTLSSFWGNAWNASSSSWMVLNAYVRLNANIMQRIGQTTPISSMRFPVLLCCSARGKDRFVDDRLATVLSSVAIMNFLVHGE